MGKFKKDREREYSCCFRTTIKIIILLLFTKLFAQFYASIPRTIACVSFLFDKSFRFAYKSSPGSCCCFLLLLMLLFVKGIEVRITILVFIHLKFVATLSKTDTFGTGTKCPSKSDVCLNESHIRREKK